MCTSSLEEWIGVTGMIFVNKAHASERFIN